jgi:hypothetical protein
MLMSHECKTEYKTTKIWLPTAPNAKNPLDQH